ncbi:hypothetical protein ACSTG9_23580, partial [Vibrio parahaemolyticus]
MPREQREALARRATRGLAVATWSVIAIGFVASLAVSGAPGVDVQMVHVLALGVFFLLVLLRLLLAALSARRGRAARVALLVAV